MKSIGFAVLVLLLLLTATAADAGTSYTPTLHSELQAVFDDGTSAWSGGPEISLIGVIINDAADMSNYTAYSPYVWWQTYIQSAPAGEYGGYTVASGDFGGTALYMRAAIPWGSSPYTLYNATEWENELDRVTNGYSLQYGDVVLVEANAPGMFFNGKFNVNEQHLADPAKDFNVTVIGHVDPTAIPIALDDLKNPDDTFIFDDIRATGCEHYQASLVSLENLQLVSGDWAADGTVTVQQLIPVIASVPYTLTFDLKLGLDEDLFSPAITNAIEGGVMFDLTAILDQEDGDGNGYYDSGYRLWLTNASNLTVVPEPSTLALLVAGGLVVLLFRRRNVA